MLSLSKGEIFVSNENPDLALDVLKTAAESAAKEGVNKIANAIGAFFPFFGLKQEAVKTYVEEIKNSNMSPEAKLLAIANARRTYKELINQSKIMGIAGESAREGTDFSESSRVDDDWLARFMDSARFVSNDEMQFVWGRILAGEFELPRSTPPQIIRVLSEITPEYAHIFTSLCHLSSKIEAFKEKKLSESDVIIIDSNNDFFRSLSLNFTTLCELQNHGLIMFDSMPGYIRNYSKKESPEIHLIYGDNVITIIDYPDNAFPVGHVLLTDVGRCIFNIIEKKPMDGYDKWLINFLKEEKVVISEVTRRL
jgi:hypothetical protein